MELDKCEGSLVHELDGAQHIKLLLISESSEAKCAFRYKLQDMWNSQTSPLRSEIENDRVLVGICRSGDGA